MKEIENKIEEAWLKVIECNKYITDNSIQVSAYRDNSKEKKGSQVIVRALPVVNQFGNQFSPLWTTTVQFGVFTYTPDDSDRIIIERLYQEVLGIVQDTTLLRLTGSVTGLTFNGKQIEEQGEDDPDEEGYQSLTINCINYIQV